MKTINQLINKNKKKKGLQKQKEFKRKNMKNSQKFIKQVRLIRKINFVLAIITLF
jgi:hypothetical protein